MINDKRIAVVLPAYNAEKTLQATVRELPEIVDIRILVDDHSSDKTVELAERLGLKCFVHDRNYGYGRNQQTCYREALAEGADVAPRTMTDIIDVLERDGLVKRVRDPADRRSVQAVITEAGLERINAMRRDAMAKQASVAQGFTAEQLVQLRHLCLLLVRNLSSDQEGS